MPVVEANIYALAAARQLVAGTPTAQPSKRFIQVAGDFQSPQDLGSENFSDLTIWGDQTDWVNSVQGNGNPGLEADTDGLAWLLKTFTGSETVTVNPTTATLNDHVTVPGSSNGDLSTWWFRLGDTVIRRGRYSDCYLNQMQIEGSTANTAGRVSPTIISLDPANHQAADPTWPTMPLTKNVLIYTEAVGTFKIDTVTIRGHSQFTITMNKDLQVIFTDDIVPFEVRRGTPAVNIAVTIQADAAGLAQFNKLLYGTATPANNAKPQKRVPGLGAYEFIMTKNDPDTGLHIGGYKFEMAGVRWQLPDFPGANPDGGDANLALAGSGRIVGVNPMYRHTVTNANPTYTT
jgi:hypothetical protein